MSRTKNVFISHVHEDDEKVGRLVRLLELRGFQVRDSSITSDKPNAANSPEYIKSEILAPRIRWAGTMIVLITELTHESDWVNWEIDYAQYSQTRIVGVWYPNAKNAQLPEHLRFFADAIVGWNGKRIAGAIDGEINDWTLQNGLTRTARDIPRHDCS